MFRLFVLLICTSLTFQAYGHDDDFWKQQMLELTKRLYEQDQRLLRLERKLLLQESVGSSASSVTIVPQPVKTQAPPTPEWLLPESWQVITPGMSRVEVEAILGKAIAEEKDLLENITLIYRSINPEDKREGRVIITYANRVEYKGIFPPKF